MLTRRKHPKKVCWKYPLLTLSYHYSYLHVPVVICMDHSDALEFTDLRIHCSFASPML